MNKKARKRLIVATAVLVLAFVAALVWVTYSQSAAYLHVGGLTADHDGKQVKVSGKILDPGARDQSGVLAFTATEDRPQEQWASTGVTTPPTVKVTYKGQMPAQFEPGTLVVVVGTYDAATNTIAADELQTKCPSKYESQADTASPQATP